MAIRHEQLYTLEEFYARGEDKREELIDGFIYDMATPNRRHQGILGSFTGGLQTISMKPARTASCIPRPLA